jgi:hypothetical protein
LIATTLPFVVDALASDVKAVVIRRVVTFADFTPDNDPHGEHDFGGFELAGRKFFWKIDHFDTALEFGSEEIGSRSFQTLFCRKRKTPWPNGSSSRGTEGSNPSPSTGESAANRTSSTTPQARGGRARITDGPLFR